MKIICHRANISGPDEKFENNPIIIDKCISLDFDVEIDLRIYKDKLYLGHDKPQYEIDLDFILKRCKNLWIHCKDKESLQYLNKLKNYNLNYFYHTEEDYVLTSKKYIWCFPAQPLLEDSICVLPEITTYYKDEDLKKGIFKNIKIYGICTDYPYRYL